MTDSVTTDIIGPLPINSPATVPLKTAAGGSAARAATYAAAAQSKATLRSYADDMRHFVLTSLKPPELAKITAHARMRCFMQLMNEKNVADYSGGVGRTV